MGVSRMGGCLDPWYLSFPGFPADHLPAQLVSSQSLRIKAFISVGELEQDTVSSSQNLTEGLEEAWPRVGRSPPPPPPPPES